MDGTRALIVADPSAGIQALGEALASEGYQVDAIAPADLAAESENYGTPDLILVSASLGPQKLALASLEFAVDGAVPTTVVVSHEEDDLDSLESCVRAGYDYLVPPFLPGLLRTRLSSCWERGKMKLSSVEVAESASLHDYERQLSIAHQIQSGFLPEQLPNLHGWQLATGFRPAKEVSGDFYDAFELANCGRTALLVADVCDKGVPAALFMALIRTLLRHTAEYADEMQTPPIDALREAVDGAIDGARQDGVALPALQTSANPLVQAVAGTNRYLARNHMKQGYFATMFFGLLDPLTGSFLYINGGHNPPVLARANGERSLLAPTGPAVGMMSDSVYALGHQVLGPGDSLFIYSDGVTDARNADGEFFGLDRLLELVGTADSAPSAEALVELVDTRLKAYVGHASQYDDITMMVVRNTHTPPVPTP